MPDDVKKAPDAPGLWEDLTTEQRLEALRKFVGEMFLEVRRLAAVVHAMHTNTATPQEPKIVLATAMPRSGKKG